jgi:PAS domain S-box-containing protein
MSPALRALYAEDNDLDAELTRSYFSEHAPDFEIEIVATGQACIDRLSGAAPDLLLLDNHLPDMEGLDVLREVLRAGAQVPVVLVTGAGDEDLVVKALHLGASNYVPKVGNYIQTLPDLLRGEIEKHRLRQREGLLAGARQRILYVEHVAADIDLTLRYFAEVAPQLDVDVVTSTSLALARLARSPAYDAALIDLRMPDQSGLDFVRDAGARQLALPPFIMISGKGDEAAAVAALKLGAVDFVAKREGYLEQLVHAIDRAITHDRLGRLNERLRGAQAMAHLGSWELDLERNLLSWSDEVYRIFGVEPQAFGARYEAFLELVHPDDRGAVDATYSDSVRQGKSGCELEHRIVRRSTGEVRTVHEKCVHTRDGSGRVIGSYGMVHDITERVRAEEALRESEERFRIMADRSPVIMWVTDREGGLQFANRTYREFFGVTLEQMRGSKWEPLIHPDDVSGYVIAFSAALREQRPFVARARMRRADGEWRWVASQAEPRSSSSGEFLGYVGASVDVTEPKRAEDVLREADQRKNAFLAMLSHELRNPLAPIRNSIYLLDRAAPGGEQAKRALRIIDRQTAHMTRLIDDLLDVSRISRGKINLQRERLDLCDLVRRTIEDHRSLFDQRGVALDVSLPDEHLWVNGDATRLSQAIGNLLHNGAKFTTSGGTTSIAVERDARAGFAVIRVRDTGIGISAEILPHLFEAFTQADSTLDRSRGGMGLGLALVKGLVELHSGTVDARSKGVGTGAEFTVHLPLARPAGDADEAATARHDRPSPRRRVLVIEDNVDAAESLKEALELGDHEVAIAFNGPEGLDRAHGFKPDVVLCDIGLPGMDGYQVARAFRADAALKNAFLVALTGYAGPEDQQRASEAGFERHLAKPPSMGKIELLLAEAHLTHDGPAGASQSPLKA